jgi:hypothetical protein
MLAIARLHNFCINERVLVVGSEAVLRDNEHYTLPNVEERDDPAEGEAGIGGVETICTIHTMMTERVRDLGLERPM